MKPNYFALISDIHGNIDALESVFADIAKWPCRGIFCLGDIVGYGAEPAACVQRIMDECALTVLGNHEAMLFLGGSTSFDDFGARIGAPLRLAHAQLTDGQMAWLKDLPICANVDPITVSHASLHDPAGFHYILNDVDAKPHFKAQETPVHFHGHTHVPVIWEANGEEILGYKPQDKPVKLDLTRRYSINVGSVGQPRDEDTRASYALYDFETGVLHHRRVGYDIARAQRRIQEANLPMSNALRLGKGE